jgi:hypothetical protein
MGACSFKQFEIGKYKDMNEAYRTACRRAEEYAGTQDGYNGTISTTVGFALVKDHPRFGSAKFIKWLDKEFDKIDKRECIGIEVTGVALTKLKVSRGFKGQKGVKGYFFFGLAAE